VSTDSHFLIRGMLARIQGVARHHEAEVGPLIVELVRRQLVRGTKPTARRRGRDSDGAHRGGIRQPWTPDLDAQLQALHATGKSDGEIGTILGRHQTVVSRKRRELGLPSNFRSFTDGYHDDRRTLAEEVAADAS
jgi:hypothetical protein